MGLIWIWSLGCGDGLPLALVALSSSDWWYAAESQRGRSKYDGDDMDGRPLDIDGGSARLKANTKLR